MHDTLRELAIYLWTKDHFGVLQEDDNRIYEECLTPDYIAMGVKPA
jgi:hypothetical protein